MYSRQLPAIKPRQAAKLLWNEDPAVVGFFLSLKGRSYAKSFVDAARQKFPDFPKDFDARVEAIESYLSAAPRVVSADDRAFALLKEILSTEPEEVVRLNKFSLEVGGAREAIRREAASERPSPRRSLFRILFRVFCTRGKSSEDPGESPDPKCSRVSRSGRIGTLRELLQK
jgi:hypothetical protein